MPEHRKHADSPKAKEASSVLKGWQEIAAFLGEPVSVVQRWAAEGMPYRREGRFVSTTVDELNQWLGKESGKPVHVATGNQDLAAELKRGLSFVRGEKSSKPAPEKSTARLRKKASP
jgi:hypothetical protein